MDRSSSRRSRSAGMRWSRFPTSTKRSAWRRLGRWATSRSARRWSDSATSTITQDAVAAVFREEAGRLTAALVRSLGDFDLAEECVQDALVAALEHWPREGVPASPGAWLMTTAKRKGIDRLRRAKRYEEKIAELEEPKVTTASSRNASRKSLRCCT